MPGVGPFLSQPAPLWALLVLFVLCICGWLIPIDQKEKP